MLPERFTRKFRRVESGCWEWIAGVGLEGGYGRFHYDGVVGYAHRYAYERCVGEIPAGHVVDHLCRNRLCVNPSHLRACTQRDNAKARYQPTPEIDGDTVTVDLPPTLFDIAEGAA